MANPAASPTYFASEIHSPLVIDEDHTFALTMSTSADVNGKAPMGAIPASSANGAQYGGQRLITVEPSKHSDLQVRPRRLPQLKNLN